MNTKRWLLASLAVLAVFFILDYVVHGVLLHRIYRATASVWRPGSELQAMLWLMWLSYLVFAPFFALIYAKGYEKKKGTWQQGLRYGFLIGVLLYAPSSLMWYVMLPIPGALAFYWFLGGLVESMAAGLAVGLIYRT